MGAFLTYNTLHIKESKLKILEQVYVCVCLCLGGGGRMSGLWEYQEMHTTV
jgi:hypothetical protein